jgi:hypothetical protein
MMVRAEQPRGRERAEATGASGGGGVSRVHERAEETIGNMREGTGGAKAGRGSKM